MRIGSAMMGSERYQIILDKVAEEAQPATALFLSGCFSLPPASTASIVKAGPIALLSDLARSQADAILAELAASMPQGVTLTIEDEKSGAKVSRLQWPRPPRIYGRDLGDFHEEPGQGARETVCPYCGGKLTVRLDERGELQLLRADDAVATKPAEPPSPGPESDKDPLFSGIKPLAMDSSSYASMRFLQAGDTGFWNDLPSEHLTNPPPNRSREAGVFSPSSPDDTGRPADSSGVKRAGKSLSGKGAAGRAAFMKPGAFSLILGRTKDSQAVKMIAEIMGITEDEAREKSMDLGLCVARDISLDEAQNLMARFKNAGTRARIVKPM